MPKKLGINTKAVEARARKDAAKQAEKERKEKEAEDALWKDDDKQVLRKMQRKDERERKKQEQADKKAALKAAYEEEMNTLKSAKALQAKVTRADIVSMIQKQNAEKTQKKELMHDEVPLEENINRLEIEGESARTVDEAISVLSSNKEAELDRHPERRVKAAYAAFEEANLPRLKAENPNLRLSQLKQMLKKDWMKSPENPLNQKHVDYNSKKC